MGVDRFIPRRVSDLLPPSDPASPRPFDAAIFDFDGTIALSGPIWHEVDAAFFAHHGLPLEPDVPPILAALGFEEGADYVIERYAMPVTQRQVIEEWNELAGVLYRERVVLRPGVEAYLNRLRAAGIALALATTNQPDVINELAPRIDVAELFDGVVYSLDVGLPKNDPAIYLESARRLGAVPGRSVVFEDIPFGLAAAASAGFATVGVVSGDENQDVAAVKSECDLLIEDWSELAR